MKRIALFLVTNLAVLVLLSIVVRVLGLDVLLAQQGIGANALLILAAAIEMMDTAYKRWLETTRQFYAAPMVSAPQVRQPT